MGGRAAPTPSRFRFCVGTVGLVRRWGCRMPDVRMVVVALLGSAGQFGQARGRAEDATGPWRPNRWHSGCREIGDGGAELEEVAWAETSARDGSWQESGM